MKIVDTVVEMERGGIEIRVGTDVSSGCSVVLRDDSTRFAVVLSTLSSLGMPADIAQKLGFSAFSEYSY
jgi:hypothetical protein